MSNIVLAKHPKFNMTFPEVVNHCFAQPEFVQQWERLSGHKINTGLLGAIDVATGYQDDLMRDFIGFVRDVVWDRA
jgi:hypothetical protein